MNIDAMSGPEQDAYWQKKGGYGGKECQRCKVLVQAFMQDPQWRVDPEMIKTFRPGMLAKGCIAVSEGIALTRDNWVALFGAGREIQSSFVADR